MSIMHTIKPSFFMNECHYNLSAIERIGLIGLIVLSDDLGCFDDRPIWLKAQILPYDTDINFEDVLKSLLAQSIIEFIEVDEEMNILNYYQLTAAFMTDCCEVE